MTLYVTCGQICKSYSNIVYGVYDSHEKAANRLTEVMNSDSSPDIGWIDQYELNEDVESRANMI